MSKYLLLVPLVSVLGVITSQDQKPPNLTEYKKWQKVNPSPVRMADRVAMMCAPAPPAWSQSLHGPKFITVYVNRTGQKAMMDFKTKSYPEGTVIVKEKLAKKDDKKPELVTVMVKRPKGFAPENGDWEFLVADASGKITARGKETKHCGTCHAVQVDQDHVFRTYLGMATLKRSR